MGVFPENLSLQHQIFESVGPSDSHGNGVGVLGKPIDRKAVSFLQLDSLMPISADFADRTVTDVLIHVMDPSLYSKRDTVLIDGQAFEVVGERNDWSGGLPWRQYAGLFGGQIHVRRVT